MSQTSYANKVLIQFEMQNSKKYNLLFDMEFISNEQYPKTPQAVEEMRHIPYASAIGSLMYAMHETKHLLCSGSGQ